MNLQADFVIDRALVDPKERAVNVSFSSESPIQDRGWGPPVVLLHEAEAADLSRLQSALLNHDPDQIVGRVEDLALDRSERKGRARVVFDHDDQGERAFGKVRSGSLAGLSVSYRPQHVERVPDGESWTSPEGRSFRGPLLVADHWQAVEISLTPIPADTLVGVGRKERSGEMDNEPNTTTATRTVTIPAVSPEVEAERGRIRELRTIAKRSGLQAGAADEWIDAGLTPADARERAHEAWASRSKLLGLEPYVEHGRSGEEKWISARAAGVLERVGLFRSGAFPPNTQPAPARLADLAREAARMANRDNLGSDAQVVERELAHSTSFFVNLLENAAEKALGIAFQEANSTFSGWVREGDGNRLGVPISRPQLSEAPSLDENFELMPLQEGSFLDRGAKVTIKTFGRRFSVSRQVVINDDLGFLDGVVAAFGRAAKRRVDDEVYGLLVSNPTLLADNTALFHSSHANLLTGGASALSSTSLTAARKAMRIQTGPNGALLGVQPKFILCPPSLETAAEELTASLAKPGAANETLNVFRGLDVIVEPRLESNSASRWYLVSAKESSPADLLYLGGARAPTILREQSTLPLGVAWVTFFDFGVSFVDHRGIVRNDGV